MLFKPSEGITPIQLYQFSSDGAHCETRQPAASLSDCIHYYWWLEISAPSFDLKVIPDNALDLVVSPQIEGFAALYFPVSEQFVIPLNGPVVYCGISMRFDSADKIFPVSTSALRQVEPGSCTLRSLGIGDYVESVQGITNLGAFSALSDHYFSKRRQQKPGRQQKPLQNLALRQLVNSLSPEKLETFAIKLGVSERQLRRVTSEIFGLSPKKIQRITRLQSALNDILDQENPDSDLQFYDDSHRIKELKRLTGLTPREIRDALTAPGRQKTE